MQLHKVLAPLIISCGFVGSAYAEAPASTDPAPHAGDWSLDMRMPVDVMLGPSTLIGVTGFGLGVGKRVTNDWYVGGTADYEMQIGIPNEQPQPLHGDAQPETGGGLSGRWRGGAEARYIFHQGTAQVSVNDGPYYPIPRYDWIGARAGVETLDGGTTHGEYAEVELGTDGWMSSTQVGMYLSAGVSIEPSAAYGVSATGPEPVTGVAASLAPSDVSSPMTTSKYFTIGWRLAFG